MEMSVGDTMQEWLIIQLLLVICLGLPQLLRQMKAKEMGKDQ